MRDPARAELRRLLGEVDRLVRELPKIGDFDLAEVAEDAPTVVPRRPAEAPDPFDRLVEALGLDDPGRRVFLLAAAPEASAFFAQRIRAVHPRHEAVVTVGLALALLADGADERADLQARIEELGRVGALEVGTGALDERAITLADGLWAALAGIDVWPAGVEAAEAHPHLEGLERWLQRADVGRAVAALARDESVALAVVADDVATALHRAAALAARAGRTPVRLRIDPQAPRAHRAAFIHCLARGVVPVFTAADLVGPPIPAYRGPLLVGGTSAADVRAGDRALLSVAAPRLVPAERRAMWRALLPDDPVAAETIATSHALEGAIALAVRDDVVAVRELGGRAPESAEIAALVLARAAASLPSAIEVVEPRATYEDLVLSSTRKALLVEAVGRIRRQGKVFDDWSILSHRRGARGVRLLLSGASGTGKTLAAEVIAGELGTALFVVDLSRVVSKWLGETEKNLAEAFDAAERTGAVLMFDEADSLFAARTRVNDAHDRHANFETAFLLQRLERFEGLAVLTTNLRPNMDAAFSRRFELIVEFEAPNAEERERIWEAHLGSAPRDPDLDLARVARAYPLVGGQIKNAALTSAFAAAAKGEAGAIGMAEVLAAIRREYEASGRSFSAPAKLHQQVAQKISEEERSHG